MQKNYISLGLMSGTSGDGVDASLIISNGIDSYESIKDKYFEYNQEIFKEIHGLKEKINNSKDIKKYSKELLGLEKKITIFHAKIVDEFSKKYDDFLVGFHGQTIFHNSKDKISKQLGDGKLLNQLVKKKIIFNFRNNDIENGGEGAPLTPLFHQLLATQKKIKLPVCFLNIGGIANISIIKEPIGSQQLFSRDIGPGNCLIDMWVRKNSNNRFDKNAKLALIGKRNEIMFEQAQIFFENKKIKKLSYDVGDFDVSFMRGLSLEDGAKTLTDFTSNLISGALIENFNNFKVKNASTILCGGGRKNKYLVSLIETQIRGHTKLELIDNFKVDGDFIESQAFAFLAIRSILNLPITFPNTTGCKNATSGGELINN